MYAVPADNMTAEAEIWDESNFDIEKNNELYMYILYDLRQYRINENYRFWCNTRMNNKISFEIINLIPTKYNLMIITNDSFCSFLYDIISSYD
jgi:predicted RecB family nuclease